MCTAKHQFIFCTCQEQTPLPKTGKKLAKYTWTLTQYIGKKETKIRGKILGPKQDLGAGITIEAILTQLNSSKESFDFPYAPKESHALRITQAGVQYFTIKYQEGQWIKGGHPVFTSITKEINHGTIIKIPSSK